MLTRALKLPAASAAMISPSSSTNLPSHHLRVSENDSSAIELARDRQLHDHAIAGNRRSVIQTHLRILPASDDKTGIKLDAKIAAARTYRIVPSHSSGPSPRQKRIDGLAETERNQPLGLAN
jgi:hypothetical protein